MGSLDWWMELLNNHHAHLQILATLQNVTGTITQKSSTLPHLDAPTNSVSGSVPSLLSSVFFSDWASTIRRILRYLICSLLVSSLDLSCLHADRIWNTPCNGTLRFFLLSSKRVFRCCVNSIYLAVITETLLCVLPRNRCLCHNLGDVFQEAGT
jgi:hypothetical protein